MTHNTTHVFNCCALIACGLVLFSLQCFSFSGGQDGVGGHLSAIGLWPLVTAALLVTTGCIGLVGYVARSLACGLLYVAGVIVFQLEVVGVMTWAMASAKAHQADYVALGCLISLGAMLFYAGLPRATKPERKLLRALLSIE
ncbi:uncharacterized protein ACA1_388470 [Acanthamoeba castellanii str. Neff]|uniref:Uncharacterized protein n=1 Tax=Acanthamoeba castellanii (strain ATCC 30010 / Neff) TaxID=1257118 RepID=L8GDR8_ACACF|nr:uncharacterized protein ACA1_388470 [Acanthamoeba castellanii str. Neff]ELR11167.1 hypothetical protein ACA1_388470 [Acanthamoeba castellanii str. Neff]